MPSWRNERCLNNGFAFVKGAHMHSDDVMRNQWWRRERDSPCFAKVGGVPLHVNSH